MALSLSPRSQSKRAPLSCSPKPRVHLRMVGRSYPPAAAASSRFPLFSRVTRWVRCGSIGAMDNRRGRNSQHHNDASSPDTKINFRGQDFMMATRSLLGLSRRPATFGQEHPRYYADGKACASWDRSVILALIVGFVLPIGCDIGRRNKYVQVINSSGQAMKQFDIKISSGEVFHFGRIADGKTAELDECPGAEDSWHMDGVLEDGTVVTGKSGTVRGGSVYRAAVRIRKDKIVEVELSDR